MFSKRPMEENEYGFSHHFFTLKLFKVEFVGKTSPAPLNDSQPKVHVLRKQRGREAAWCQLHQAEAPGLVLQGSQ